MKNIFIILLITLSVFSIQSCSDFLDVNESPNNVTSNNITPDLILAGAQVRSYYYQSRVTNQLGNVFMNNWGANINSFSSGFVQEFSLSIDNTFYSTIWDRYYLNIANFQNIIDNKEPKYENYAAVSKIMKAFYMQYIVDLYGDVPYSEAFTGGKNLSPKYDDAKSIYRNLYTILDEATTTLSSNNPEAEGLGANDVIFKGDISSWVKFANTLKLRLLVRESGATDADSKSYVADKFAELNGSEFMTNDVTINPGYSADNDKQNPFWDRLFTADGKATTTYQFLVGTKHAIDFLSGATSTVVDNRLEKIYGKASDGTYSGVVQGETTTTAAPNLSPIGPGILKSASQDGYIMTASESYFLQAEAAFNGFISGDAKSLFESGVKASFDLLGADIGTYLSSTLGWDSSADKIKAIMTQKWIATNGLNAIESWIDYTRTGFPVTPLALTAQKTKKPLRLMYPSSEYVGNSENVPAQTQNDAFEKPIFWNK